MSSGLDIAFFGSSLLSAYWNGAATYYRGIIRALAARGHRVTFYEPDAFDRQIHRDIPVPWWARVVVYAAQGEAGVQGALDAALRADVIIKASGVGVFDELLEAAVADLRDPRRLLVYWDVDAPATLARMAANPADPLRSLIPAYDVVLTYGGGEPVVQRYLELGARDCVPVYNALDPTTHYRVPAESRFACDLAFLGNRLPDREARVSEFFLRAAEQLPHRAFLLGGAGWETRPLPPNVRYVGHVYTRDHNALNSTARLVLNVSRASMAEIGFCPATRVFEAAGAGACIVTDAWDGIEQFLTPGEEVLVAHDGVEVAHIVAATSTERAVAVGLAARRRILREHTYAQRALLVEDILSGRRSLEVLG